MDMKTFNENIIKEFRENKGRVSMFADYPMVVLHTIGAKSGNELLVPLVLTINQAGEWLLFASFAGAQKNPAWVYNLRANPTIEVEFGESAFTADITELPEPEANEKVNLQAKVSEQFSEYVESAAPRRIPVFRIENPPQ